MLSCSVRCRTATARGGRRYAWPYVVAADVYAAEGLMGRGGWTWYTGSASWLYRITLEALLGIVRRGDKLRIAPVIPRAWPGFEVRYRHGASTWRIVVENTAGGARERAAPVIDVDGKRIDGDVPLRDDGKEHLVRVVLGAARAPAAQASPAAGS